MEICWPRPSQRSSLGRAREVASASPKPSSRRLNITKCFPTYLVGTDSRLAVLAHRGELQGEDTRTRRPGSLECGDLLYPPVRRGRNGGISPNDPTVSKGSAMFEERVPDHTAMALTCRWRSRPQHQERSFGIVPWECRCSKVDNKAINPGWMEMLQAW